MKKIAGQTLLEILIALVILGIVLTMFIPAIGNLSRSQVRSRDKIQAAQYAREGLEITYNISLHDWLVFKNLRGVYHPIVASGIYVLETGDERVAGKFNRSITIQLAKRDEEGNITENGTEDSKTLKVTSRVSWMESGKENFVEFDTNLANLEGGP